MNIFPMKDVALVNKLKWMLHFVLFFLPLFLEGFSFLLQSSACWRGGSFISDYSLCTLPDCYLLSKSPLILQGLGQERMFLLPLTDSDKCFSAGIPGSNLSVSGSPTIVVLRPDRPNSQAQGPVKNIPKYQSHLCHRSCLPFSSHQQHPLAEKPHHASCLLQCLFSSSSYFGCSG